MNTYAKPTHLVLVKHGNCYTIDKLYGTETIVCGQRKFSTVRDATDYANREWHGVSFLFSVWAD